ncbi:SMP-30/gluconolactonase/LRE family protein [Planctomicrobium sp. SH527]|uniref:SMP-30/gluconolactonase/LRE family protein n=1 Tax=Planctomicrobium sp. SH527 TaxID=3448123 RepID=UPI003F5AEF2A
MKISLVASLCTMALVGNVAVAQNAAPKSKQEFQAGQPLGSINEAGEFVKISDNVKVYGSFRFAESCVYDSDRDLIVVMNAGVAQNLEPNDGYVSLLNPDGSVHTTKWIGATRNGLTLNHPLGSAIQNGILYAADIDVVRTFDLKTGQPGKEYPVEGATFLNGIAVAKDGTIFVSNTRPESRVYKITPEGKSSVFVDGQPLVNPNGVAIDQNGNVVVVNVGDKAVMTFDSKTGKLLQTEHAVEGGNDGLVILQDGTKYVSSVRFGSVSEIRPGQPAKVIASGIPSAASMAYDPKQKQLIIPMNNHNAMAFIKLDKTP